jgi:uncharacterized RmlC-like cupin family protein
MKPDHSSVYYRFAIQNHELSADDVAQLNLDIQAGFERCQDAPTVRKTHNFGGRYENIYLDERYIPQLATVVRRGIELATELLGQNDLRAGYWFNAMPPGSVTTLHRHDDFDELYSAVYYVTAPDNSGDLIIHDRNETVRLTPKAGDFIFFKPEIPHEVSRNDSTQQRLSIGFNFGPAQSESEK